MKAVVFYGKQDVRVEDIPEPKAGAGELLVRIDACAVCGSDLKTYHNGNPRMKPPMTMGHEFTGTIVDAGIGVSGFSSGERVVMATSVSCGECYYCKQEWNNLCLDLRPMGFFYPGGMAEFTIIPSRAVKNGHVVRVPDGMVPEHAALAEPVSCAVNALANCRMREGDTVVVVGAGPLGIMNLCAAREMGAGKVILAQRDGRRFEMAKQFHADLLVNTTKEDLVEIVKQETGGVGADCVVIAAPSAEPQEQSLDLVHKRGSVCLFASLPVGKNILSMDSRKIHYNEINVVGASDSRAVHVRKAVELLSKKSFPAGLLASHILGIDEIEKAISIMTGREGMRVVLKP